MKTNRLNIAALAAVGASLLIGANTSQAGTTVSASFIGRNDSNIPYNAVLLSPSDVAGVVAVPYWANLPCLTFTNTSQPLRDSSGAYTAVQIHYEAVDSWNSDGPIDTADEKMMKGILKFKTAGTTGGIWFSNLSVSGTYDVYVYCMENGTGSSGTVQVQGAAGPVAYAINPWANNFTNTYTEVSGGVGNFIHTPGVAPQADGTIQVIVAWDGGAVNDGVGIAGLQLVQITGPPFAANTIPCAITTQPANSTNLASSTFGLSATFSVVATGPHQTTWNTNGVPVPGVIADSYTTPPLVLADNLMTVQAVVSNNVNTVLSSIATNFLYLNTNACAITANPVPVRVPVGTPATFTVAFSGPLVQIQWQTNSVNVPNATGTSLTLQTPLVTTENIRAIVYNNVNTNVSTTALLTVAPIAWNNQPVSASFNGRNGSTTGAADLPLTDVAGAILVSNWNNLNIHGADGNPGVLVGNLLNLGDAIGGFTPISVFWSATDGWNDGGYVPGDPNTSMMNGFLKMGTASGTVIISNVPAGSYDLYVYAQTDTPGTFGSYNVGAQTYYLPVETSFPGSFALAYSTDPANPAAGNTIVFKNVSPDGSGNLKLTVTQTAGTGINAGVAGLQLAAPGTKVGLCAITQNPTDYLTVENGTAIFTVGASGVLPQYQWTKNGVDMAGQTTARLVFTPVLADNNANIAVKVYNNAITNISTNAKLSVDAATPPQFIQGFLQAQRWEGLGTNTGANGIFDIKQVLPGGFFPTNPTVTFFVGGAAVPQTVPRITSFGQVMSGWIKPDVTGDYAFLIESQDSSELYLNPVGAGVGVTNTLPNPNSGFDFPICYEYGCCNGYQEYTNLIGGIPQTQTTPATNHLLAGNLYGFVVLHKVGTGNGHVSVAWRLSTDTTPAKQLTPIPAQNCWTLASAAGHRATLGLQPVSQTVFEDDPVTFTVSASVLPPSDFFGVQWYSNSAPIIGSAAPAYNIAQTVLAQNGLQYNAKLFTLVGTFVTTNATLTVLPDTNAPTPVSVGSIQMPNGNYQLSVEFQENGGIDPATFVAGNFSIVGNPGTFTVATATNTLGTYSHLLLQRSGLVPGQNYTLNVVGVADKHGNAIKPPGVNLPFTASKFAFADNGTPIRPGNVVPVGPDGFDILNGGRQQWSSYEEDTLAYIKKTNDFDVKVNVVFAEPGSEWTRVGLQARNNLNVGEDPGDRAPVAPAVSVVSAKVQVHVNPSQTFASSGVWVPPPGSTAQPGNPTPNNGHEQHVRPTQGAQVVGWGSPATAPTYPNAWLRLQRVGTNFFGYRSTDGTNWIGQGTTSLASTDNRPDMVVSAFLAIETANIWGGTPPTGFDVYNSPFDPNFDRLFLAQFRNFGDVAAATIPTISISRNGSGAPIITFTGTLYSSTTVNGTYTPVSGAASPYTVPTTTAATTFFKAHQ